MSLSEATVATQCLQVSYSLSGTGSRGPRRLHEESGAVLPRRQHAGLEANVLASFLTAPQPSPRRCFSNKAPRDPGKVQLLIRESGQGLGISTPTKLPWDVAAAGVPAPRFP